MSMRPHPGSERPLDAPALFFRLADEIARLKAEPGWAGGKQTITLAKQGTQRVVLVGMHAAAVLEEHVAPGAISVQLLEGSVSFTADGTPHALRPGDLLTLAPGRPHAVRAEEASVFLLTLAQPAGKG